MKLGPCHYQGFGDPFLWDSNHSYHALSQGATVWNMCYGNSLKGSPSLTQGSPLHTCIHMPWEFPMQGDSWGTQDQAHESLGVPAWGGWGAWAAPGCTCYLTMCKNTSARERQHLLWLKIIMLINLSICSVQRAKMFVHLGHKNFYGGTNMVSIFSLGLAILLSVPSWIFRSPSPTGSL